MHASEILERAPLDNRRVFKRGGLPDRPRLAPGGRHAPAPLPARDGALHTGRGGRSSAVEPALSASAHRYARCRSLRGQ